MGKIEMAKKVIENLCENKVGILLTDEGMKLIQEAVKQQALEIAKENQKYAKA
ncbi:hypothetical protein PQ478_08585 [Alkalihalophilus pseudofirmus]|uniref:hypothetical protein n=1 Tax=Alkalihalophilus pseudofirmus TaxID=79885 RepID=UPI00259B2721|nr:hypothetical protein [Alkalihalophilus pseudofirmus]WEG18525.1 hypothetical protein PQ478_08585 [Alkalihalophilus pseudofirmus]